MAVTLTRSVNTGARTIIKSIDYSETGRASVISESVADSATDAEVVIACDVTAATLIYINSTQDILLETIANGGGVNISLLANKPYVWNKALDGYLANLFVADFASLFFTNASGSAATIDIEIVQDATP